MQICNQVFNTLDAIEEKITEALRPYREKPMYARSLVGNGWLHTQANAMLVKFMLNSFGQWYKTRFKVIFSK